MKLVFKKISAILVIFISSLMMLSAAENVTGVERYALYIGSNIGGVNNQKLMYATSDAFALKKAMAEIGGVNEENSILLYEPTKKDVDSALKQISDNIISNQDSSRRSEFIFYYSGHSDEEALILGKNRYEYSQLKESITNVPSDVHVVILDSCYSGNFIRAKGGKLKKSFLVDDSSVVKGHAYLSSSSSVEVSQESDEIGSSFFTNAIITGLRGAADTSGDKKVSLNELYSYAFNETLVKTESSSEGPQHPNYNITLVGSGDLILSDISASDSYILIPKGIEGKVIIKDRNGKLVSEVNKPGASPICLALEASKYVITVISFGEVYQKTVDLSYNSTYVLNAQDLEKVAKSTYRNRGGSYSDEDDEDDDDYSDYIDFSIFGIENKPRDVMFGIGMFGCIDKNVQYGQISSIYNICDNLSGAQFGGIFNTADDVEGFQAAGIFNTCGALNGAAAAGIFNIAEDVDGFQGAGIFNIAEDVDGFQGAGMFNIAEDVDGFQGAGIFNIAENVDGLQCAAIFNSADNVKGLQLGLVNVCENCDGVMIGLFNYCENGIRDITLSRNSVGVWTLGFKNGTTKLFSDFSYGTTKKYFDPFNSRDKEGYFYNLAFGLGHRTDLKWAYIDWELLGKSYYIKGLPKSEEKEDFMDNYTWEISTNSLSCPSGKITFGIKLGDHCSIFAGTTLDCEIKGWNEAIFKAEDRGHRITVNDKFGMYPSYEFGFSIRF